MDNTLKIKNTANLLLTYTDMGACIFKKHSKRYRHQTLQTRPYHFLHPKLFQIRLIVSTLENSENLGVFAPRLKRPKFETFIFSYRRDDRINVINFTEIEQGRPMR